MYHQTRPTTQRREYDDPTLTTGFTRRKERSLLTLNKTEGMMMIITIIISLMPKTQLSTTMRRKINKKLKHYYLLLLTTPRVLRN
jgi:hypothetical protein